MLFHSTTLLEWTVSCAWKVSIDLMVFLQSLQLDAYVSWNIFFLYLSQLQVICAYLWQLPWPTTHLSFAAKGNMNYSYSFDRCETQYPSDRLKSIYSPFIFKSFATEHFHQIHSQCRDFERQMMLHYVGYLWERLERSSNMFIFTEGSSLSIDRHQRDQPANTTGTSAWVTAKLGLAIVHMTSMGHGCPSPHKQLLLVFGY